MSSNTSSTEPFLIKNCALSAIATGERASSLLELRDKLLSVDIGCIYHHFWGARMDPQFVHPQYHNDFAHWVYHRLHDHILAEKLNIIDPTEFESLEDLRQEVVETIEKRLDDYETILWIRREDRFHFIRSSIIAFETTFRLTHPKELLDIIPKLPPSSIFYHFIDARARTAEKLDDFSIWLKRFNDTYTPLIEKIHAIDPYFLTLNQLKEELIHLVHHQFHQESSHV